jgi:uncharacterized protein YndB with AHSA1/START domain
MSIRLIFNVNCSREKGDEMKGQFTATADVTIKTDSGKVWDALTNPELIKQYLFGTEARSEWKVGSSITYTGVWQGKAYQDKGKILELVPNRLLKTTFWSALSGLEDTPENYNTVTYQLAEAGGRTRLTVAQDNNSSLEEAEHSEANWRTVLQTLKELLEE